MDAFLKKLKSFSFKGSVYKKYTSHPDRDWLIMFYTFSVINLLIAGLLFFEYQKTKDLAATETSSPSQEIQSVDKNSLVKTLEVYREKKNRFESLLEERPESRNPAI